SNSIAFPRHSTISSNADCTISPRSENCGLAMLPARACASISPLKAILSICYDVSACLIGKGRDAFYRRVVFTCCQGGRVINLYGRSITAVFAHRFLHRSKGGLYAWDQVQQCPEVILVEGLFDYAVLWQAGLRNVTCSFGTHLNACQFQQLCA